MNPDYYQTVRRQRLIVFGSIAGALLLIVGLLAWHFLFTLKTVKLTASKGSKISFGTLDHEGGKLSETIAETSESASVRVSPGQYAAIYSGEGYETKVENITVSGSMDVKTPSLSFNKQRLASLLVGQKTAIKTAVDAILGTSLQAYNLEQEQLYLNGDWYAAKYAPLDRANKDDMRIILQKKGTAWTFATDPGLIFYAPAVPTIPKSIVSNINNL